mgnify:CR=1 FL=1
MRLRIGILSLILVAVLAAPIRAQQPDLHRAGLVVVHGDGNVVSVCVAFAEESISGAELLRRSGLGVVLDAYGGLGYGVCAIGGEGCFVGHDCFCQCRGNPCAYWVYSHRRPDGSWAISGVGASGWQVHNGDVDGWVWGDGSTAPPIVAFEQVCLPDSVQSASPIIAVQPATPTTAVQPATPTIAVQPATPTTAAQPPSLTVTPDPLPTPILPTDTPQLTDPAAPLASQPTISPTSQPTPLPTVTPIHPAEAHERDVNPFGYIVFGIVVLGLAGWLTMAGPRGRHI